MKPYSANLESVLTSDMQVSQSPAAPRVLRENEPSLVDVAPVHERSEYSLPLQQESAHHIGLAFGQVLNRSLEPGKLPRTPTILVGNNGHALLSPILKELYRGLCDCSLRIEELGQVTSSELTWAVGRTGGVGGLYLAGFEKNGFTSQATLWGDRAVPLPCPDQEAVDSFSLQVASPAKNLSRKSPWGGSPETHASYAAEYLEAVQKYFPRMESGCGASLVAWTKCSPLVDRLRRMTSTTPHGFYWSPWDSLPAQGVFDSSRQSSVSLAPAYARRVRTKIAAERARGGVWIDPFGEICLFFDEQGNTISSERIFFLAARQFLKSHPAATVVVESDVPGDIRRRLESEGAELCDGGSTRESMYRSLEHNGGLFGGGSSGRFWATHASPHQAALIAIGLVLSTLCEDPRPLSEIVKEF